MGAVFPLQISMRRSGLFSVKNLRKFLILAKIFEKRKKSGRFARGERTIALDCHEVRWPLEGIGTVQNLFRSSDQVVRITAGKSCRPDDKNPTGWLDGSGIAAANPGSIKSRLRFLRSPENSAVVSSPFPETPTSTPRSRLDRRRKRAGPGN